LAWQRGGVKLEWIHPAEDERTLHEWFAIWRATDLEKFPDETGWDEQDIRSMALVSEALVHRFLLAREDDGIAIAAGFLVLPVRDNLHAAWADLRVTASHRRQGIGRAVLDEIVGAVTGENRRVINHVSDMPIGQEATHPSRPFVEAMGFVPSHAGHRRSLHLPLDPAHLGALNADIAGAPGAQDYRMITLRGPWPDEFVEDQCALERAMSTDQPLGDEEGEEEAWDAARIGESDRLWAGQGLTSVVAAAQHIESGRLVAYTRMAVSDRRPTEAWQWATIVLKEHRGHRLGLAVKVANLAHVLEVMPTVRKVITSNAAVNEPMIAVNDLMGFEIDAVGQFWQKWLVDR
jgi:GNAT superfamily N-acetyltransferase